MRFVVKPEILVAVAGDAAERAEVAAFAKRARDHVFAISVASDRGFSLHDLGPRDDACRVPINVISSNAAYAAIGNLAHAPFDLDGRRYASVEGFWQGLKTTDDGDRERIAALHGAAAKSATKRYAQPERVQYGDRTIVAGTADHWDLMHAACLAKFRQNEGARRVLLATGDRPLVHRVRRDSRTIPGVVMADIWMRIRAALRES